MSDVFFVKTKTHYDPYMDYFRLAELSGYPVIYIDEMDAYDASKTYIFTPLNGENNNGWRDAKANIILHDMEWRLKESDYAWTESDLTIPQGVKRVWTSDKWYAERIGAQYVPLGSHTGLAGDAQPAETPCDVAPLCYRSGRRSDMLGQLTLRGVTHTPNAWGAERDALLKVSTAVVHIHQHDKVPTVAPLRFAIAAAWHKPLISEAVHDDGVFGSSVLYTQFGQMADYVTLLVRRYPELLQAKADMLHETLCVKGSFRSFVEAAL